jgi:L-ascorbate metabolism protein UlaG (beta-lactamase superfamily)
VGKYTNLDGSTPDKGLADVLRWQWDRVRSGKTKPEPLGFVTPSVPNDGSALLGRGPHFTWVGHATFAFKLGQALVVTDPLWSESLGPTVRRLAPPGIALANLPKVDVVTVSHSHFDHLDLPSLKALGRAPTFVVPRDVAEVLQDAGIPNVVELDWWQSVTVGDVKITLVPAQHWSMRMPWDKNNRLWGGFIYESSAGTAYHAGDTAFSERTFSAIRERFPDGIDWAMFPIGAYDPDWFMKPQHINPEDAVRAAQILGVKDFLAMHWGTFRLTDEALDEPPARVRRAWEGTGQSADRLHVLKIGETCTFDSRST